jgi:hypothetical protein
MLHGQSPAEAAVITVVSTITALVGVLRGLVEEALQLDVHVSAAAPPPPPAAAASRAWSLHAVPTHGHYGGVHLHWVLHVSMLDSCCTCIASAKAA